VPAGQTPYSVSSVAQIDRDELDLAGNGLDGATSTVHLSGRVDTLDQPRYGALSLELEEPDPPTMELGGVRVAPQLRPSILIPVVLVPLAGGAGNGSSSDSTGSDGVVGSMRLSDSIRLELNDLALSVGQRDQNGWLDRVIPVTLPGLADHGPLLATAAVQNTGNAFGRAFTSYEFTGVNPLDLLPEPMRGAVGLTGRPFLQVDAPPAALMPEMLGETHAATTYVVTQGAELDSTPWFGLVRVRATTRLVLADFAAAPVSQDVYVLVAPWKEALVLVAAWALWRAWRKRFSRG
jgi:hypothetical protein